MKPIYALLVMICFLASCGGGQSRIDRIKEQSQMEPTDPYEAWETNHGVGPIKAFELPEGIDEALAGEGQAKYEALCTACHKIDKRFIGPSPQAILTRRTPAWIMNMILNPEEMVQEDPLAKKLFMEYNGSPMANQNLSEDEARAVLEYFRTL